TFPSPPISNAFSVIHPLSSSLHYTNIFRMARSQIQTSFPAGISPSRFASTELIGAYDEMRLESEPQRAQSEYPLYHPHPGRSRSESASGQPGPSRSTPSPHPPLLIPGHQRNTSYDARLHQPPQGSYAPIARPTSLQPAPTPTGSYSGNGKTHGRQSSHGTNPRTPTQVRYNLPEERVYMPTTAIAPSNASTSTSRRRYDKLADVYSMSGDTVDFARNMGDYIDDRCPRSIWFGLLITLILMGLLMMLFGAFNIPFCFIQPMIPIYLLVSGLLVMLSCGIRMFGLVPAGNLRGRPGGLSTALCCNLLEGLFLLANVVWLILGAIWVYGSKRYVVFHRGMFDDHFCDEGLYWFAFTAVTLQIGLIILGIIGVLILVCMGAFKEVEPSLASLEE
ncbi:hypothetical protein PENTCL1PPCAC_6178, partial [Pristionchus entomophagus]